MYAQISTRFQTTKDLLIEESTCAQNIIDFLYFVFQLLVQTGKFCVLFVLKIILLDVFHLHQEPDLYELCQQPSLMSGFHLSSSNEDNWVRSGEGSRVGSGCLFLNHPPLPPSPPPAPRPPHTYPLYDSPLKAQALASDLPGSICPWVSNSPVLHPLE